MKALGQVSWLLLQFVPWTILPTTLEFHGDGASSTKSYLRSWARGRAGEGKCRLQEAEFYFFSPGHLAREILVSDQGSNPHPLQWKCSPNQWTTREVLEAEFSSIPVPDVFQQKYAHIGHSLPQLWNAVQPLPAPGTGDPAGHSQRSPAVTWSWLEAQLPLFCLDDLRWIA